MFLLLLAAACGSSSGMGDALGSGPVIDSFTAASTTVLVGEGTELTAVFSGGTGVIVGIGPVQSGIPVVTPALARTTTFMLAVSEGSQRAVAEVTVAAAYRNRFRALTSSPDGRHNHVTMALPTGGALIMGGNSTQSINTPDTDATLRFDPVAETFSPGPTLAFSAMAEGFTLPAPLPGGGFLLTGGGINSGTELGGVDGSRATQVFDDAAGAFHRVGDLSSRHRSGAAAVLGDGSVFVSGGETPSVPVAAAERYDPSSGQWTAAGVMGTARRGHTATTLQDGRVLLVGGCCDATGQALLGTAEIFDPVLGGFQPTGSLATARAFHTATLLPDGRVVVTGGFDDFAGTTALVEIFDPATGRFEPGGALQAPRALHAALLLTDGRVLVLGGQIASEATDVFDPAADHWDIGPALQPASKLPTATLLSNGKALVFGGEDAGGFPVSTAFLYE